MNEPRTCPQEPLVLAATDSSMSGVLSLHVQNCTSCQESKALAAWMRQLAAIRLEKKQPDADVIWIIAQLSKPRTPWTRETVKGVVALAASALLAAWSWPTIAGFVSSMAPKSATSAIPFLTSCVVATGLAGVAVKTIRLLTGE